MIEEISIENFTIKIDYCIVDSSPIEEGDLLKVYHWHNKHNLGKKISPTSLEFFKNEYEDVDDPFVIICPLYMLDHSGVSLSISDFGCRWDSGQVGYVAITKADVEFAGCKKSSIHMKKVIMQELETFQNYLNGNIFSFSIERNGEPFDSCSGFYNFDRCKSEALDIVEHQLENALREINKHRK